MAKLKQVLKQVFNRKDRPYSRHLIEKVRYILKFYKRMPRIKKALSFSSGSSKVAMIDKYKPVRVLLPLIETSHYKCIQLLLIAKALELRGATVKVVICGEALNACEIRSVEKDNHPDPCWRCRFNQHNYLPLFNLDFITLKSLLNVEIGPMIINTPDLGKIAEEATTRHFYGAVPNSASLQRETYDRYLRTAEMSLRAAIASHMSFQPTLVLGYMMAYAEWAPWYNYYNSVSIRFRHIGSTQFSAHAQHFHWPQLFENSNRFKKYIQTRSDSYLNDTERIQLQEYFNKRYRTDDVLKKLGLGKKLIGLDKIKYRLNIDTTKRNIFLFSSVLWDVGISDLGGLYSTVLEWVFDSIRIVAGEHDVHLYIRCHPAEQVDSSFAITLEKQIHNEFPKLPDNVTIISSSNEISSYSLFSFIDLGVTFIGTIGLEMLQTGIPIVCTGKAPYAFLSSVAAPQTRDEYREMLIDGTGLPTLNQEEIDLFQYFYFLRTPIPWSLTRHAYIADILEPLPFHSLETLLPGNDKHLDHLCACLIDDNLSPEAWPD